MSDKSVADQGSLAITARGDGNRWYGRVSIPELAAKNANLQEGMRISAKCSDGKIIIQKDDKGPIKFPGKTGKNNPRHAFEAATATLGLKETQLAQTDTKIIVEDGKVLMLVPEDCLASSVKERKKSKKDNPRFDCEPTRVIYRPTIGTYGAAAAIITEANRAGKQVRPMNAMQIIEAIREKGHLVQVLGPRLFKYDNIRTVTISDLQDIANDLTKTEDNNKIVLIAD